MATPTKSLSTTHKTLKTLLPVATAAVSLLGAVAVAAEGKSDDDKKKKKPQSTTTHTVTVLGYLHTLLTHVVATLLGLVAVALLVTLAVATGPVGLAVTLTLLVAASLYLAEKAAARREPRKE